jgi:DNA-directed RNA polymerase beta' subunit
MTQPTYIESFTISRLDQMTLDTFARLDYDSCKNKTEIEKQYYELMGYNPSSALKNKQECKQCGKFGYSCMGHPVRIDIKHDYLSPFSKEIESVLKRVFCFNCGKAVFAPKSKTSISAFAKGIKTEHKKAHSRETTRDSGEQLHCKVFVEVKDANVIEFLTKLDADDLEMFGISKRAILNLINREIVMLPLSLQPSDERNPNPVHTKHYFELMALLRGVAPTTGHLPKRPTKKVAIADRVDYNTLNPFEKFRLAMDKLLVGDSDERSSHVQMCEGKDGLFRGSACGKRAWNTARGVLTPVGGSISTGNQNASMGVLMVSKTMADILKYEYVVSPHNIEWLQTNATHVIRMKSEGQLACQPTCSLFSKFSSFTKLQIGDRVLRSLKKGDAVVFNRFPTLDNVSLVGYSIEIWDNACIGLHQVNAPPHNADFDGDEGNLHVGNNSAARIEMEAMSVKYRIMRTKSGEASTGITYNGIIGCYLLSQDDQLGDTFERLVAIIGLNTLNKFKTIEEQVEYYRIKAEQLSIPFKSGRTIISMLLPRTLNYSAEKGKTLVKDGFFVQGKLKKSDVADKLISAIFLIDKFEFPFFFVNKGYEVSSYYASVRGITLGIREYCHHLKHDEDLLADVNDYVESVEKKKATLTDSGRAKQEDEIMKLVGAFSSLNTIKVRKFLSQSGASDLADVSYESGARGSIENVASAIATIGQLWEGSNRLSRNTRLSPYSNVGSKHIVDNGFLLSSYASGLRPKEVMAQAIPSRESAFNIQNGTPTSGAAARQACLHLGGIVIDEHFQVVGRSGEILSYLYGTGSDTIYTAKKPSPLDKDGVECPVDWVHILESL